MNLINRAFFVAIAACIAASIPTTSKAVADLGTVTVNGCSGSTSSTTDGGSTVCVSGSGGSYGGGGGTTGGTEVGGGGGGGSYTHVPVANQYTVGNYHCDDCSISEPLLTPANSETLAFIKGTVNKDVMTWRAKDGTLKNVIICNGACGRYQYTANGNYIRSE